MSGEWATTSLADLCDPQRSITYGIVQPGKETDFGIPIVRVNNFSAGKIDLEDLKKVSPNIEAEYARSRLRGGELLVTLVGSIGQAAIAPDEVKGFNVARAVGVVPIADSLDTRWAFYMLTSSAVQDFILSRANTTVQTTFNLKDLSSLTIPFPPKATRSAIINVLSALDDKIALIRRMEKTLNGIAGTLFRSWLVDFEPVRRTEAGQGSGLPASLAVHFPTRLTDKGIPEEWKLTPLSSMATFLNGLALQKFPATAGEPGLPVIKIAEMRVGPRLSSARATTALPSPNYIVDDGDHLFSWSGSLTHCLWSWGPGALNQHLFKVIPTGAPAWLCYWAVEYFLPEFQAIASGKAVTMGHIQRHHLDEALLATPPKPVIEKLGTIMEPLFARLKLLALEIRTLTMLRDTLLPKLISGELRVRDAEHAVAGS